MPIRKDIPYAKPQNKKKKKKKGYQGGGLLSSLRFPGVSAGGGQFTVRGDFLRGLLDRSGISPDLLQNLRIRGLGNAPIPGRFSHPTVIPATKVPKARAARKAGKAGGMVSRGNGIARTKKGKKYV